MGTLSTGKTWTTGEVITAALLNQMVNDATVVGLNRDDFQTGSTITTVSASAPATPAVGEGWFDTSELSGYASGGVHKVFDGSKFRSSSNVLEDVYYMGGTTSNIGDLLVIDTGASDTAKQSDTANDVRVLGVAMESSGVGNPVRVARSGNVPVRATAASAAIGVGDPLVAAGAGGNEGRVKVASSVNEAGVIGYATTPLASGTGTVRVALGKTASAFSGGISLAPGSAPRVTKTGNQTLGSTGTPIEVTFNTANSFTTSLPNEIVMLSITGLSVVHSGSETTFAVTLDGTSLPSNQITFGGNNYGSSTHGDFFYVAGGETVGLNVTIPVTVASAGTHRFRLYATTTSAASVIRVTPVNAPATGYMGGLGQLMVWKLV